MQHPNLANPNHPNHDSSLIAGHAAGDLTDSERARAQALLDTCAPCLDLHRDLIAIAGATRTLPNLATAPRDFRLTAEQAARLRRRSWIRAVLRPFAAAGSPTRPLAAAFTSLGIAGVFVVTILPGLLGGPASMSSERDLAQPGGPAATQAGGPAATRVRAAATFAPAAAPGGSVTVVSGLGSDASGAPMHGVASARPDEVDPDNANVDPVSTPKSEGVFAGGNQSPDAYEQSADGGRLTASTTTPNPILVGSLALLAVGVLLFGLRFAARRVR